MKIAIVGSGISSLTAAYKLNPFFDITVFEKNDYIGGHTNTINLNEAGRNLAIDTGFIVFNKKTYPNFVALMDELKVGYQKTSMSFGVQCERTGLVYNGTNFNKMFAQRKNILKPSFYRFLFGIAKFNQKAKEFIASKDPQKDSLSLGDFIARAGIAADVVEFYLVPMAAAVWSADSKKMWDFPALFILRFWQNHGFLEVNDRPMWYVIKKGSKSYIPKITASFGDKIRLQCKVEKVEKVLEGGSGIEVTYRDAQKRLRKSVFDKVVLGCHSDEAFKMLSGFSRQKDQLDKILYQKNTAILHSDLRVLAHNKLAHAAWNYYLPSKETKGVTVHYYMNILQGLKAKKPYIVSLNPEQEIEAEEIHRKIIYHHPIFTPNGMRAQKKLRDLSSKDGLYFAGAYLRYGFHEDGVLSGLKVYKKIKEELYANPMYVPRVHRAQKAQPEGERLQIQY